MVRIEIHEHKYIKCTPRQQYCLYVKVTTLEASLVSNNQLQLNRCSFLKTKSSKSCLTG